MENTGLLVIPDISGFSKFVHEIDILHSKNIIQELLEILISANELNLEVSEIEGDAILFYRYGASPDIHDVYRQVEKMFCDFHRYLAAYEISKYCQCAACISAINLTLKVITHYGEFTGYNVRNFSKLIGKDVIVAHQLLKNDIPEHEYWLVTDNLLHEDPPSDLPQWMHWSTSAKQTETGEVTFKYVQLTDLKKSIGPQPSLHLGLDEKTKMFSLSREYDAHIITMFHATGNFGHRHKWQTGIVKVEELDHYLPRVGMRCRYTLDSGEVVIYSTSYSFDRDRIEFGETDEKRTSSCYFTLERIGQDRTRLTIDYYLKKDLLSLAMFKLTRKKKLEEQMQKSMENLEGFVKEIKVPISPDFL